MTLPLETFRRVIGYNPWHFWGWDTSSIKPSDDPCDWRVMEYAWQKPTVASRDDIRREITFAEQRLKALLGFRPAPEFVEVQVPFPKLGDARMNRMSNIDTRNRRLSVFAREGMIREVGHGTRLLIDPAATPVYTDEDGDGIPDTFTITAVTGLVTEESEVAIYVPAAERTNETYISERWRIAPVNVAIAAGTVTITGRAWMMARPILYEGLLVNELDPTDAGNYLDEVELYRYYANHDGLSVNNSQAVLVWESYPYPSCASSCCGLTTPEISDPDAVAYAIARCGIRDGRMGHLAPGEAVYNTDGTWSDISWTNCREPDKVILRFKAGAYLEAIDGKYRVYEELNTRFDEVIARLAIAQMTHALCECCEDPTMEWSRWQSDVALVQSGSPVGAIGDKFRVSESDLSNPLGTRAGEVYAWRAIKSQAIPSVSLA